ncbi:hypothetical protein EV702DRAFT_1191232 [Suillus placidus]|uniref:Uncharacterized protein n=1 Tax=Suillus placidus TaxID=48579 RepID=A0A9P7D9A2_9AGAM|nr:hypothetical protein EV702DRAFT_1191232 [Suillus placidus]
MSNTSDLSNMVAHNFKDLLQCVIPVFDELLPHPHNIVVRDLFTLAHWHGVAKLRMHSDLTLDILDQITTELGNQFHKFKVDVCAAYDARELDKEDKNPSKQEERPEGIEEFAEHNVLHRKVSFNLQTYKFHSLGDYASCIRHFGTTDSYSTELGELELEHHTGKGRYLRTDRKTFIRQLAQIERRQTRIHCIKSHLQQPQSSEAAYNDPSIHHHIGLSKKINDDIGSYLCLREGNPAMKDMLPVDSPSDTSNFPREITFDGRDGDENEEIDDENSEYEHTGGEKDVLFDQEQNGSTASIIEELDNMFAVGHKLDYES